MVAIIDYGMGNLGSIRNMFAKIGVKAVATSDPALIRSADKLVLPGVGAFDNAVKSLAGLDLDGLLTELVMEKKRPVLGICLGMQLMTRGSEEGTLQGFGWIDAETRRFRFQGEDARLRIPHMGWNEICVERPGTCLDAIGEEPRFYFVHSYHVCCADTANVLATTTYGYRFHSAIVRENIIGTQFHPEKSHKYGLRLLKGFSEV